jgi:hypothetical protein
MRLQKLILNVAPLNNQQRFSEMQASEHVGKLDSKYEIRMLNLHCNRSQRKRHVHIRHHCQASRPLLPLALVNFSFHESTIDQQMDHQMMKLLPAFQVFIIAAELQGPLGP